MKGRLVSTSCWIPKISNNSLLCSSVWFSINKVVWEITVLWVWHPNVDFVCMGRAEDSHLALSLWLWHCCGLQAELLLEKPNFFQKVHLWGGHCLTVALRSSCWLSTSKALHQREDIQEHLEWWEKCFFYISCLSCDLHYFPMVKKPNLSDIKIMGKHWYFHASSWSKLQLSQRQRAQVPITRSHPCLQSKSSDPWVLLFWAEPSQAALALWSGCIMVLMRY